MCQELFKHGGYNTEKRQEKSLPSRKFYYSLTEWINAIVYLIQPAFSLFLWVMSVIQVFSVSLR